MHSESQFEDRYALFCESIYFPLSSLLPKLHTFIITHSYAIPNLSGMNEKSCIVCQDFPVFHKIQISEGGIEKIQYLCSEHFDLIDDPKRFFSLLETHEIQIPPEEVLYTEFFSD